MLHCARLMTLFLALPACAKPPAGSSAYDGNYSSSSDYGAGGSDEPRSPYTMPFPSGEYWYVTQTYDGGSHQDYGFEYGDDTYAIDFSQSGCDAYGKSVTPIKPGTVMRVFTDGDGDHGYGNSVLVDHGDGLVSRYGHFSDILVDEGDAVNTTTPIGEVGNSGYAVGTACSDHPGTHLHLALYQDGVGIKPEPLSGLSPVKEGCWVSREGWEDCGSNPGDYESIDDEGVLLVQMLNHSPTHGTAQETEFVWVAQVDSPDMKPDVTLHIYNDRDEVTYDFTMESASRQSPWVFIFQKNLRDTGNYDYWVSADNGDGNDTSPSASLEVYSRSYDAPEILASWTESMDGDEFEWRVIFESDPAPEETLLSIVNPYHPTIFQFEMDMWHDGDTWDASYEKSLDDETTYPFWMEVYNGESVSTSPVEWLRLD